jgi:hypothetical protein
MDWLINTVFSIVLATDVRSPDPAIAALKQARLLTIVCALGAVVFLVLVSATQPDDATVSLAHVVQEVVWRWYAGGRSAACWGAPGTPACGGARFFDWKEVCNERCGAMPVGGRPGGR